jgi:hypothetical protein
MASTPEVLVKKKIHALLREAGAYAVNYIGGQFASNGTPDILACLDGRFIGIEAKAGRGKPTALQVLALKRIDEAGGLALCINENSLDYLKECLSNVRQARSNWRDFASILERAQASPD